MTTDDVNGVQGPNDEYPGITSSPDLHVLRNALLESVSTSPDAFLATEAELKAQPLEYWKEELRSSTWAVVKDGDKILGIAAAKPPRGDDKEYADPAKACFIESVWIAPSMRRNGVGERLVTYIIEERRKAGIQQFYLWVFHHNTPAIGLYEQMDFGPTGWSSALPVPQACEIQYVLGFDSDVIDDDELKRNAADRELDREKFGITYRLLDPTGG